MGVKGFDIREKAEFGSHCVFYWVLKDEYIIGQIIDHHSKEMPLFKTHKALIIYNLHSMAPIVA